MEFILRFIFAIIFFVAFSSIADLIIYKIRLYRFLSDENKGGDD